MPEGYRKPKVQKKQKIIISILFLLHFYRFNHSGLYFIYYL